MDNPVINQMRESRQLRLARFKQKGAEVYATFDKNERTVVQFGMFPHDKMLQAQAELAQEFALTDDTIDLQEIARELAVAIMDAANAGPDKLVV
jgi:rRNA pseudouridine-1189 N-methylase Emg1 (Nep1/Mra1 family)